MTIKRIKRIPSHSGHARFIAETDETPVGYISKQPEIPSPYAYSPTHTIWNWNGRKVFIVETSHKQYDVFEVPASLTIAYQDQLDSRCGKSIHAAWEYTKEELEAKGFFIPLGWYD